MKNEDKKTGHSFKKNAEATPLPWVVPLPPPFLESPEPYKFKVRVQV